MGPGDLNVKLKATAEQVCAAIEARGLEPKWWKPTAGPTRIYANKPGKRDGYGYVALQSDGIEDCLIGVPGERIRAELRALAGASPSAASSAAEPVASEPAKPSVPGTNAKPGVCTTCGGDVPVGAGQLWWEADPDDGGDVLGRTPAGWRVTHLRSGDCDAVRAARRAEQDARKAASQAKRERIAAADALAKRFWPGAVDGWSHSPVGERVHLPANVSYVDRSAWLGDAEVWLGELRHGDAGATRWYRLPATPELVAEIRALVLP